MWRHKTIEAEEVEQVCWAVEVLLSVPVGLMVAVAGLLKSVVVEVEVQRVLVSRVQLRLV